MKNSHNPRKHCGKKQSTHNRRQKMHSGERAQNYLEIREESISNRDAEMEKEWIKTTGTNRNRLRERRHAVGWDLHLRCMEICMGQWGMSTKTHCIHI